MRKTEVQFVLNTIASNGLELNLFKYKNTDERLRVTLIQNEKLTFSFKPNPESFLEFTVSYTIYKPHYPPVEKKEQWMHIVDATSLHFDSWIKDDVIPFMRIEEMADPLAEIYYPTDSPFNGINDRDTERFDATEKHQFVEANSSFKKLLEENFQLPDESKAFVERELSYLERAIEHLNKRDFKAVAQKVFYDISINIASNVILDVGKELVSAQVPNIFWRLVGLAFRIGTQYLLQS